MHRTRERLSGCGWWLISDVFVARHRREKPSTTKSRARGMPSGTAQLSEVMWLEVRGGTLAYGRFVVRGCLLGMLEYACGLAVPRWRK